MYKKILQKIDLTPSQAEILEYLYKNKEAKASTIAREIKRSRAIVYKELDELADLELVKKYDKPNQISVFRAEHPRKLKDLMEKRINKIKKEQKQLNNYLPDLISSFSLINNKPGIKFYEGQDGIKKVLYDTLESKTTIYTISDTKSVRKNLKEINEEYVAKRKKKKIMKKLIVPLSAKNEFEETESEFTKIRFLDEKEYDFKTGMQIYDNKVSYQTLDSDNMIGILIEDKNIYSMQKMLFEHIWNNLTER